MFERYERRHKPPDNQVFLIADAVTVVLYSMMVAFAQMDGNVGGEQYLLGFVSFFTISLGGFGIGVLCGLLTALITRTTSEVRGIYANEQ